jgi:hypothetical protein
MGMPESPQYHERVKERLAKKRDATGETDCWNYTGTVTANGYGHMSFAGKVEYTHRVAAVLYLDFNPNDGQVVMHECDNPRCFNPAHLAVGTQKQNMADAAARGRMTGGKKLTATQAGEIKYLLGEGKTQRELATRFGVSTTTIGQIYRGQTWRQVAPLNVGDDSVGVTAEDEHR